MNEYLAFRTAHGIDDKSYKDLYLGDYFTINDGTYNVEWMVAHFDYYVRKGNNNVGSQGVLLIPKGSCGRTKMYATDTTTGGYNSSIANTTACPAIATALSTVFGSYLLSNNLILTTVTDANIPSKAGSNIMGAATGWAWFSTQCVCPSEIQIYGSTVCSSSFYDTGEACQKLAIFNFINYIHFASISFWLRDVVASMYFGFAHGAGYAFYDRPSYDRAMRPLIYIG